MEREIQNKKQSLLILLNFSSNKNKKRKLKEKFTQQFN